MMIFVIILLVCAVGCISSFFGFWLGVREGREEEAWLRRYQNGYAKLWKFAAKKYKRQSEYYEANLRSAINCLEEHDDMEAAEFREHMGWDDLTIERLDELRKQKNKKRRECYGDDGASSR